MSEQERTYLRKRLNEGLKESFEKMLRLKKQLGQSVVTCDNEGNPITISAEEAWEIYQGELK